MTGIPTLEIVVGLVMGSHQLVRMLGKSRSAHSDVDRGPGWGDTAGGPVDRTSCLRSERAPYRTGGLHAGWCECGQLVPAVWRARKMGVISGAKLEQTQVALVVR